MTARLLDFLTNRPLGCVSDTVICRMGGWGAVPASPLFTIYTSDFIHHTANCHLQKFSDDKRHRWSHEQQRREGTPGTDELGGGLSKGQGPSLSDEDPRTRNRKGGLLQVHQNLDWPNNTQAGQSRLHLLRRLRSFRVSGRHLKAFYDSVVASATQYAWSSSITVAERKKLNKIVK